jgi:hypothetical protein|nr:MAG TPA: hypothetical protein [Caudoviricetes sp.]
MITILDDTMRIVDVLRKYEYSQYQYKAREIGTFQINAMLDKENLYLMDKTKNFYVLFDDDVFGVIESVKRESDSETSKVFVIKGSLALKLLEYRVIKGQVTFKGKSYKYIEELVKQNLIMSDDSNRNIALSVEFEDEERLKQVCSIIDKQVTGGSLWDEISEVAEADKLRIVLKPNVVAINRENPYNIDGWTLIIGAGEDRTRHRGNKVVSPVVFSQSLSNIANTDYIVDRSKLKNTVYIAGEGEGTDRKWYNIDVNSDVTFGERKGWNRKELWVDARDIQSEQDNKKLTDAEYEELMKQRADEKAKDNDLSEEYTATVTDITKQYTYKKDYNIGDFVTIADEELGMEFDAQITNVIVTRQDDREIIDLEFTYGLRIKDIVDESKVAMKKIEQTEVNVKYIENSLNSLSIIKCMTVQMPSGDVLRTGEQYLYFNTIADDTSNGMLIGGNGAIKIGKGVKSILVSFTIFSRTSTADYLFYICEIWRNGAKYKETSSAIGSPSTQGSYMACTSCDVLIEVQEGDELWLKKSNSVEEIIRGGVHSNLTVKVVSVKR